MEITLSRTNFLILHEAAQDFLPEVLTGQERRQPTPIELLSVLRFILAAYETKTTTTLNGKDSIAADVFDDVLMCIFPCVAHVAA